MRKKFEIYKDANDNWRWRLKAPNGKTIATSAEGYTTLAACKNGIRSVRVNAWFAPVKILN